MSVLYAEFKLIGAIAVLVATGATSLFAGKLNYDEDELYVSKLQRSKEMPPMQPSQLTISIRAHRQYSRKVVWLKHVVLFAAIIICLVHIFYLPKPLSEVACAAWLLQIVSLVLFVYLDDVRIIGTGYQKKFLYVYFLLTLLGAIEFVWQQTNLSLSLLLCYAVVLGASIFVSFFNFYKLQANIPTPEYTSNLLTYLSFSYLNAILIKPNMKKEAMEFEDVPRLHDDDCTEPVYVKFQRILRKQSELDLTRALLTLVWPIWLEQGFFQWLSSTGTFFAPLALEKILIFVNCSGDMDCYNSQGFLRVSPYMAVFILFLGPLMKSVGDGQNYVRGRHIGVRLKAALIGCIFNKSINVDLSASRESVGKLNNLISTDVGEIQNFWCYSHFMWSTFYEIVIATTLLCLVLGKAAMVGIVTMLMFMVTGFYLGAKLEGIQTRLLANKDKRISIINEVLNSIRIIKYYAWEGKFIDKINVARLQELSVLLQYCATGALLFVIWEVVPSLVGVVAFLSYTQVLGHSMSPSMGFTALTLFSTLRFPLSQLPEMTTLLITCRTSLRRIREYLVTADLPGLPSLPPQGAPKGSIIVQNLSAAWRRTKKEEDAVGDKSSKKTALCDGIYQSFLQGRQHLESRGMEVFCCFSQRQLPDSTTSVSTYKPPSSSSRPGNRYSRLLDDDADADIESALDGASIAGGGQQPLGEDQDIHVIVKNVSLRVQPGSLNIIIGATGAGKSSLLSAILGETLILSGERFMVGEVAYSTQTAWIQNETLRDNILFGAPFDPIRYDKVIKACSLEADLKLFPLGDQTEIGEKGVNLSGGQQQRVSLARAAYAKSDIIILDDPLSAVDAHVGEHIFRELILDLLKDRTVLLVTHNLPLALAAAHQVLYMDAEQQTLLFQCPPRDLHRTLHQLLGSPEMGDDNSPTFMRIVYATLNQIYGVGEMQAAMVPAPPVAKRELSVEEMLEDHNPVVLKINLSYNLLPIAENKTEASQETERDASTYDGSGKYNAGGSHQIVATETKTKGEVTWQTYWFYFKAWGGVVPIVLVVVTSFWIAVSWFLQSYTLGLWMQSMTTTHSLHNITLTYYLLCVLSLIISYIVRGLAQVAYTIKASEKIHSSLIKCILLAPCGWFDATPIGRIINRCSQDISTVDSNLMYHLLGFIDCLIGAVQVFMVIIIFLPPLLLFLLPVMAFTAYVTYQYVHISRELKRLESLKKSPVFVLFSETLHGLSVLRAFANQPLRFHTKLCSHIDNMNSCHLFLWICNRWLNFRMQCLGALVSGAVAAGIVYSTQNESRSALSSASAGLALMYSLGFCDNLTFLARSHADCQMDLNSVERIEEYSTTTSEKYNPPPKTMGENVALRNVFSRYLHDRVLDFFLPVDSPMGDVSSKEEMEGLDQGVEMKVKSTGLGVLQKRAGNNTVWPSSGHLVFQNVSLRYPSSPTPVLRGVNFDLPGGKRLGVVGRTGAGKSSLVSALFRLVELEGGKIFLDDKDTSSLPLISLRQAIGIVPQEPSLFGGTLRSNLDPFTEHSDQDIWNALRIARLEDYIRGLAQKQTAGEVNPLSGSDVLNSVQVAERGGNFSRGQRQLLCLARALLRPPPLLILDECTASVDAQTDALIQEAVRYGLPNSTVLCIAHRLQTVAYYDLILLLDGGAVKEFGCPHSLLQNENSAFFQLCQSSGALEELKVIAAQAAQERLDKQSAGGESKAKS